MWTILKSKKTKRPLLPTLLHILGKIQDVRGCDTEALTLGPPGTDATPEICTQV